MPQPKPIDKRLLALGLRVKKLREKKGWTLEQLGEACNKDRQSIGRLEKGKVNPGYIYLLEIAKGLDTTIVKLLARLEEKPKPPSQLSQNR